MSQSQWIIYFVALLVIIINAPRVSRSNACSYEKNPRMFVVRHIAIGVATSLVFVVGALLQVGDLLGL